MCHTVISSTGKRSKISKPTVLRSTEMRPMSFSYNRIRSTIPFYQISRWPSVEGSGAVCGNVRGQSAEALGGRLRKR